MNTSREKKLEALGYELKMDNCVSCHKSLNAPFRFNFFERGFVCPNCSGGEAPLSENNFKLLKKIRFEDKTRGLEIFKKDNDELFIFLRKYLAFCLDRKIISLELIK